MFSFNAPNAYRGTVVRRSTRSESNMNDLKTNNQIKNSEMSVNNYVENYYYNSFKSYPPDGAYQQNLRAYQSDFNGYNASAFYGYANSDAQSYCSEVSAYPSDLNPYYGTARMLCVRIPTYHTGLPVVLVRRDWNFTIEEFDPYVGVFF